jgi:NitT/TauT family transport system permease protein
MTALVDRPSLLHRTATAVEVAGLTVRYPGAGGVLALDGVDLQVPLGSFHAILGPSGCGKSTLLRVLTGLIPATSGSWRIADGSRPAYVPQGNSCFPWLTAEDNVAYGLWVQGQGKRERRAKARRLLARLGLEGFARSYPRQLSEGMRQRVAIARAFAVNASVLAMDEPLSALDFQTRMQVQRTAATLDGLPNGHHVTHDIDEALTLADSVTRCPAARRVLQTVTVPFPRRGHIATYASAGYAMRSRTPGTPRGESVMVSRRAVMRPLTLGLVLPLALLLLWETAAARHWIDTLFYPAPSAILDNTWHQLQQGTLAQDAGITLKRLLIGFVLGAIPGIGLGLAAGMTPFIRALLYPLASGLYVVPRIALLPLVLVAFSIGDPARIFMVAFGVFFIAFFSALSAAEQVDRTYVDTARSFGADYHHVVRSVIVPPSPGVFSGLRVAMGIGLIVVISVEFLASNSGLGAFIWHRYQIFDFPSMYSGIVTVTFLGVLVNLALLGLERFLLPWRQ